MELRLILAGGIALCLAGCTGDPVEPNDTDAPGTDEPVFEEWAHQTLEESASIREWNGDRVILWANGVDAETLVLDQALKTQTLLPGRGIGSFVDGSDGELIANNGGLHQWSGEAWSTVAEGRVTGASGHVWVAGDELFRFDIETRSLEMIPGAGRTTNVNPLGNGETAVFQRSIDDGLFWATTDGTFFLHSIAVMVAHPERIVYATVEGALFEAGLDPIPLDRILAGELHGLEDGTLVAQTDSTTWEAWDGTSWTLIGDAFTLATLDPNEITLFDASGVVHRWDPTAGLRSSGVAPTSVERVDAGVYLLVGADSPHLWLPGGEIAELPAYSELPAVLSGGVPEGGFAARQQGEVPVWVDLASGATTAGDSEIDDICAGAIGGQFLYQDALGQLHRLTSAGDEVIGDTCTAFPLENGGTWTLASTGEAFLVDAAGNATALGSFESATVEANRIMAVEGSSRPSTGDYLGPAVIQLFSPVDGSVVLRTESASITAWGTIWEPFSFGPHHVGVLGPGCIDCVPAETSLRVYESDGAHVQTVPHVVEIGSDPSASPHRRLVRRFEEEETVEVWSAPVEPAPP